MKRFEEKKITTKCTHTHTYIDTSTPTEKNSKNENAKTYKQQLKNFVETRKKLNKYLR